MNDTEARTVVRAFTIFFDLVNLAEDRERIRVLRERERARIRSRARSPWKRRCSSCAGPAWVPPTSRGSWTSCPSAWCSPRIPRRPSGDPCGQKSSPAPSLVLLDDEGLLPRERERLVTRIRSLLTGLWQTELIRPRGPSVLEEVEVGLYFATTLWEVTR